MRGYWHFIALSVVISTLTIIYDNYWFVLGYFLWICYLFYHERLGKLPLLISLTFFLFFSFYIPAIEKTPTTTDLSSSEPQVFTGKIVRPLMVSERKIDFHLRDQTSGDELLVIYFPRGISSKSEKEKYEQFAYGASCEITGSTNVSNESRNPGQFDFRDYLLKQGITQQVIVDSLDDINCQGSSLLSKIYTTRMDLMDIVAQKMSPMTGAWLSALVLGDDTGLDEEIVELFQRWGLSHILAISGLHVGLIVSLVYFIIVKLNIVTKEKAQWIMIFFLPLYAMIAGGQPSVWRASMMALMFIILNKTRLKLSVTDTLSIVFLLLILFDKYIVYHIGFQLSFTVTFGLVVSRQLLTNIESSFFQVLYISFIAQMMILPLQFIYFTTFQPLSMILNVLVVPYFSLFVIPLMFLLLLFSPMPHFLMTIADTFFISVHDIFLVVIHFIDRIANIPIFIGEFPIVLVVVYYMLFYLLMRSLQNRQQLQAVKHGVFLVVLIICVAARPFFSPIGTVTMLDIGNGDAFVVELPYRKGVFFIDIGATLSFTDFKPSNKVYQQIIKPYLYARGITKIDAIFLSHEHIDHMGSVPYLLDDMKVDEIIISNHYKASDEEISLWEKENVALRRVGPSETVTVKGQTFQVLGLTNDQHSENENSLVLYTELGGKRWLFTGDIGKETERKFMKIYDQLSVDVLKVGHHGSQTSTDPDFIQAIGPEYALISVGVNNSYDHPAVEVIETLLDKNVEILRTDESGAVQYRFKNNQGTFLKYLP